jgi:hypothetical protein
MVQEMFSKRDGDGDEDGRAQSRKTALSAADKV